MIIEVLLMILVLAVAFFQSNHGLFSALLMTILTLSCAALALGSYEWVAIHWIAPNWKADYAAAIALAAVFGVPLIILRLIADNVIKRACLLPSWLDRIGGGACGLLTALVLVGMLSLSLQMIPFDNGKILDYARVDITSRQRPPDGPDPEPPETEEEEMILRQDRFAVAMVGILLDGVFGKGRNLQSDYPDLVEATGWLNAAPAGVSRFAQPDSISVVRTETVPYIYKLSPALRREDAPEYEERAPEAGHEFHMVRVQLKNEARDQETKSHHFTLRQFRLVGDVDGARRQFYPLAIQQQENTTPNRHIYTERNRAYGDWPVSERPYDPRDGNDEQVEVVFELPKGFTPDFIEYKRGARAVVSFGKASTEGEPADDDTAARPSSGTLASDRRSGSPSDSSGGRGTGADDAGGSGGDLTGQRGGNVRRFTTQSGKSFFGPELPGTLTEYQQYQNAEITRGTLIDGHLVAVVDEQEDGTDPPVSKLEVPSDKRLLHLNTGYLQARSGIGRIVSQAVGTLQNYTVESEDGREYKVCGKYARADDDGTEVFEVQYFSSPVGTIGGLGNFRRIRDRHLKGDYEFVLLFLVDPGAKIVRFSTGGASTRADNLASEDLVAPD